jgi:hypothetical protein
MGRHPNWLQIQRFAYQDSLHGGTAPSTAVKAAIAVDTPKARIDCKSWVASSGASYE